MELASMLAGERFSDRPSAVCPVVAAVVRAYNDALDDQRRQDLLRFASDAVGTRGGFDLQRRRAEVALEHVRGSARRRIEPEPDLDCGPEELADHVIRSLARRPGSRSPRRRWDDVSHAEMLSLLERLIATGGVGRHPLLGEFVEHPAHAVEDGRGGEELFVAELGQRGAEPGLDLTAPGLDEFPPPLGEPGEDDPPVPVGAVALHQAVVGQAVEHLGDAGWAEIGGDGELTGGAVLTLTQAEQQPVLGIAERTPVPSLSPPHAAQRGHRGLERPAELLGGLALLALACHAGRRAAVR
jgi:hypothetical protein